MKMVYEARPSVWGGVHVGGIGHGELVQKDKIKAGGFSL